MGILPAEQLMLYYNEYVSFLIQLGRWAFEYDMKPKDICEVLSNNKCYYKEVFDYTGWMRGKMEAYSKKQQTHRNRNRANRGRKEKPAAPPSDEND